LREGNGSKDSENTNDHDEFDESETFKPLSEKAFYLVCGHKKMKKIYMMRIIYHKEKKMQEDSSSLWG